MQATLQKTSTILLVEDNHHTRQHLENSLSKHDGFSVLAAGTCTNAKKIMQAHPLDFLVLDIGLPDGSGLDLIAPAILTNPNLLILVLTIFEDSDAVVRAIQSGAKGYLLKDQALERIVDVLLSMQAGHSPIDHRVARALLDLVSNQGLSSQQETSLLSQKEKEVLEHLSEGAAYKEVACRMDISINTVREHIRRIYKKMNVNSRHQALQYAKEHP